MKKLKAICGLDCEKCKHYRLGFDIWALILFLAVMIPTIIWAFVPAQDDILRTAV